MVGRCGTAGRLRNALARVNPDASADSIEDALRKVTTIGQPSLVQASRAFHRMLVDGVETGRLREGELRDTLLPELLSGRVRVGKAEALASAAM